MNRPPANEACAAARDVGRKLAAAGALVVALAALLAHAPVWIACARAAVTLVALLVASGIGTAALGWACACDAELERSKEGARS
jgi:hypothetical protein